MHWDKRVLNAVARYEHDPETARFQKGYMRHCMYPYYTNFSVSTEIPCCFKLGYPAKNEKEKILYGKVTRVSLCSNRKTNLQCDLKTENPVYDFEFELIKE